MVIFNKITTYLYDNIVSIDNINKLQFKYLFK